jgi:Raf kinase inhibitor-like YbhB/YbcL family protein
VALLAACSSGGGRLDAVLAEGERMPEGIRVTSSAFDEGDAVPERYSCEGENVPPPLRWEGVPEGTVQLALVVEDPEAPDGIFVHWLVTGIAPGVTEVGPSGPPAGAQVTPGSSDNATYIGPCPPDGQDHHYYFEVYALSSPARLDPDSSPVAKVRAVRAAAIAGGALVGTFAR